MRRLGRFLFALTLAAAIRTNAQTVDTVISGVVMDPTGAVIRGASVSVVNPANGAVKTAVTSNNGEYDVNYLTPGSYNVTVTASGFQTSVENGIVLQINQQARINVTLKVGGGNEVVAVDAGTQPLLQNEESSLGVVVGTESAENLPLNGRKFDDLAVLTPGVTITDPDNHTSGANGSSINAYGNQVTWAQVNLDGVTMVNNRHAYVNLYPSVDAVQEFKVYTGNYEAEYGGGVGTITNIQLKSGGNKFHGDVFEFLRNTAMDARNKFRVAPLPKQVLKQNQFGATLGGPIVRDRTFFFLSYEGLRSLEQTAGLALVPTAAQIAGDFSSFTKQLRSPCTGLPYPGNRLPTTNSIPGCQDALNPVSQYIATHYLPAPNTNTNGNNYSNFTQGNETVDQYIVRLDHKINEKNQIAAHYVFASRNFPTIKADPFFTTKGSFPIYNGNFQYVHTFNSNLVNELHLGVSLEHLKILNGNANTNFTAASIGINGFGINGQNLPPPQEGFPIISVSGMLSMGDSVSADDSKTYQLIDNFTWVHGQHTFIFGADIRHTQDNADTSNTPFGSLTFNGAETGNGSSSNGNAIADFMIGVPSSLITPEGVPLTMARQWRDFTYFQDNWKTTRNLTLNLGLRWDVWVPPHDNYGKSETLNFSTPIPTLVPLPNPLWKISHKDFSPRLGFAYTLPGQAVLRGGYGITFYGGQFDNINILQLNPPADPSFSLSNGTSSTNKPSATIQNPVATNITPATPNVTSLPPDDKHPDVYLQTWNLTFSKQFWANVLDISYVGIKGTHQDTSQPYFNNGPPQPTGAGYSVNADRPYPTFGNMRVLNFGGSSFYSGLEVHFQHRFTHGLEFTTAYSWSHLRDNQGGDTNGVRDEVQVPRTKEWANGLTDQRHSVAIAFVYQLPELRNRNVFVRGIFGGWGLNSIFVAASGSPLDVVQSTDGENNGNLFQRPDYSGLAPVTVAHKSVSAWFNNSTATTNCSVVTCAAFVTAVGHYGNVPRNPPQITSPGIDPLTLGLKRTFGTPWEGQHLEFRAEAFNALNTPQLGAPGVSWGSSTFGTITATSQDNRDLQVSLKYTF